MKKITDVEQCDIHGFGISEVAFCDNPIHDFDRCPLIKQTNNCKNCTWYNN
jgi:hypothetical protein